MDFQSRIISGGITLKVPSIIDNSGWGWASCETAKCVAGKNYIPAINYTIPPSTGAGGNISVGYRQTITKIAGHYGNVTLDQEGTLSFTSTNGKYYTNGITATKDLSTLNFAPGDYYINGDLKIGQRGQINITGSSPVRLFVNGSVSFGPDSKSTNANAANFLIYAKNSVDLVHQVNLQAFIYSQAGGIRMGFQSKLTGGVSAAGSIEMGQNTSITYISNVANADFGALCNKEVVPSISKFQIDIGSDTASTCTPKNIIITARDANNNTLTDHTGTIALTTSTGRGTWAKTNISTDARGSLVAGADNGQATYTFTAADAGDIVLALNNPRAQSLTVSVVGAGITGVSPVIQFSENAFVIEPANMWGEDIIAMRDHPFTATMMRRDPDTGNCGPATAYNVGSLRMWLTRASDDPGGAAPRVASTSLPNSQPGNNNINLSFTNGVAAFSLRTTDVGKYAINLADTSNSFASTTIFGGSNTVVARPFGIHVGVSGNPAAAQASGLPFRAADQPFTVTVRAVGWQAADDSSNDGIADGHNDSAPANNANLADNSSLVSFRKAIALSSKLISPSGGSESGLSGGSFATFSAGAASSANIRFNEVGIIEIGAQMSDGNYLGSPGSDKIMGKSGYVGRFYPDHFRLSSTAVQPSCNAVLPYSYLDEPFAVSATITPYSASGTALQNYRDDFIKLDTNRFQEMLSAIEETAPQLLSDRIAVVSNQTAYIWNNGVLTAAPKIQINRAASPDGPFSQVRIGLKPVDRDGVTLRAADLNLDLTGDGAANTVRLNDLTKSLRYGRLRLDDSYGPETANLPVVFRSEYWDGNEWKQNRDDSCTQIALTDIAYPDGPINVTANRSPAVGGGTTTGVYANFQATTVGFIEGDAGHYFTAPGAGNMGAIRVQVDLTHSPWLRFDWNHDGNFSDPRLPDAHFTFGNYRGHDRVLYWIEAGGY
jgi:MSHA biogenesis protein MshQ